METKKSDNSLLISFFISLFLHVFIGMVLLLNSLLSNGPSNGNGKTNGLEKTKSTPTNIDIVEKPSKSKEASEVKEDPNGIEAAKKRYTEHPDCPTFYGGIGIYLDPEDPSVILNSVPGYIAYNIGIKTGDKLITPQSTIKGEVGESFTLEYISDNEKKSIVVIREKICYSEDR